MTSNANCLSQKAIVEMIEPCGKCVRSEVHHGTGAIGTIAAPSARSAKSKAGSKWPLFLGPHHQSQLKPMRPQWCECTLGTGCAKQKMLHI